MIDFIASSSALVTWGALFLYVFLPLKTGSDLLDLVLIPVFWIISIAICIVIYAAVESALNRLFNITKQEIKTTLSNQPIKSEGIPQLETPLQQQVHTSQQQDEDYYYKRKMAKKGYWKVTPKQIREMDWREFESFTADLLTEQGYKTILTPAQKDEGKDIVAQKDGIKYFIECKHWKEGSSVGREYLQKLVGAAAGCGVKNVIFIATCSFHDNAKVYAKEINKADMINIDLWNINKLLEVANSIPHKQKGEDKNES